MTVAAVIVGDVAADACTVNGYVETMKDEIEQYAKDVMEAVNNAPDGAWIAGSEERVRDLSAEMCRKVFERALQKRVDAAEAAYPPSAPSHDGQAAGE